LVFFSFASAQEFEYVQPISVEKSTEKKSNVIVKEIKNENRAEKKERYVEKKKKVDKAFLKPKDFDNDGCKTQSEEFTLDANGCPAGIKLNVKFEKKKREPINSTYEELRVLVEFLKKNKSYQVIIYVHTDSVGEAKENKILSQKRANAIKKALMDASISSTKLTAIGKGESTPIANNMYRDGRELNRRVEIVLIR